MVERRVVGAAARRAEPRCAQRSAVVVVAGADDDGAAEPRRRGQERVADTGVGCGLRVVGDVAREHDRLGAHGRALDLVEHGSQRPQRSGAAVLRLSVGCDVQVGEVQQRAHTRMLAHPEGGDVAVG